MVSSVQVVKPHSRPGRFCSRWSACWGLMQYYSYVHNLIKTGVILKYVWPKNFMGIKYCDFNLNCKIRNYNSTRY